MPRHARSASKSPRIIGPPSEETCGRLIPWTSRRAIHHQLMAEDSDLLVVQDEHGFVFANLRFAGHLQQALLRRAYGGQALSRQGYGGQARGQVRRRGLPAVASSFPA